jgi:hypothetical protein
MQLFTQVVSGDLPPVLSTTAASQLTREVLVKAQLEAFAQVSEDIGAVISVGVDSSLTLTCSTKGLLALVTQVRSGEHYQQVR